MRPFLRELAELRALLETEVPQRLHADASREAEYAHQIGKPFTPEFRRYIGHSDHWGLSRLGMMSIIEVGAWCWQRHPGHRHQRDAMCEQLLRRIAYWRQDCPPSLEPMALRALRHAALWRRTQVRSRLDEPLPYEKLPSGADRARIRSVGQRRTDPQGKNRLAQRASGTSPDRTGETARSLADSPP